tara:strand:+ start:644 stop:1819 length:1176 start_codon:yes stop_codon:yes gene_type:complete
MKKKIIIITGSRAEYDLISEVINKFEKSKLYDLLLIFTGSHLSREFNNNKYFFKNIKVNRIKKIDIKIQKLEPKNIINSISAGINSFSNIFRSFKPNLVIIPGDRYEMLAAAICSYFMNIRVAHLFGGDITLGSLDDNIRHSITKFSDYHFVTSNLSKKVIEQLGEDKKNIYVVGNPGLDSMSKIKLLSKPSFSKIERIIFKKKIATVVVHPDASSKRKTIKLIKEILTALKMVKDTTFIFTKPNADTYSHEIDKRLKEFVKQNPKISSYFINLGHKKFLSILSFSDYLIGNSSAGLSEMPYFKRPTINIGDRQLGRIKPLSVIDCEDNVDSILKAIKKSQNTKFIKSIKKQSYHLGAKGGSKKIYQIISKIDLKNVKQFKKFNLIKFNKF